MKTAIDIIRQAVENVSTTLGYEVSFVHGNTLTIVNYITRLRQEGLNKVYPAICLFTEGYVENQESWFVEFTIPKIAICTVSIENATEKQRLESNFTNIIYPIFEELSKELKKIHLGYNLIINRTDIPYFAESEANTFNQLVDGCIIKNLKIKADNMVCTLTINS